MKIQQSVFTTLFLIHDLSDLDLLAAAISAFQKEHKGEYQSAGSYERRIFSPDHYEEMDEKTHTTIPRIRFKKEYGDPAGDSASHAILGDLLIPNSSYTIRFVLTVLYESLHRECTINELCNKFEISTTTYYTWKKLFEAHAASWNRSLTEAAKLCKDLLSAIQSIPEFPCRFLTCFSVSFLQSRYRNYSILEPINSESNQTP